MGAPNANREAAIARIRALLAKTTANGCTEDEALAAAAKAGELMDRYSVSLSDVEVKQERCQRNEATDRRHDVDMVSGSIARFCGCKVWLEGGRIPYFGLPHDVVVAAYLTDLCRNAMDGAFRLFLRSPGRPSVHGRRLRRSFMVGMASRLIERLDAMSADREASAKTASGTALVVVRNAVVDEQYAELGLKLRNARAPRISFGSSAAFAAGDAAGGKVALTTGIGRSNALAIEGRAA